MTPVADEWLSTTEPGLSADSVFFFFNEPRAASLRTMSSSRTNHSKGSTPHAEQLANRDWYGRVWEIVAAIPRGHVLTYGDVARLSGRPRQARRVGQALRRAPRELRLPWHRVINAQGRISLPADSAGGRRQRQLLEDEGVRFEGNRVDLERFGYRGAVDRLCWGPAP